MKPNLNTQNSYIKLPQINGNSYKKGNVKGNVSFRYCVVSY